MRNNSNFELRWFIWHTSKGILKSAVHYFHAPRDSMADDDGSTATALAIIWTSRMSLGHGWSACRLIRGALSPPRSRFDFYCTVGHGQRFLLLPTARKGCSVARCLIVHVRHALQPKYITMPHDRQIFGLYDLQRRWGVYQKELSVRMCCATPRPLVRGNRRICRCRINYS